MVRAGRPAGWRHRGGGVRGYPRGVDPRPIGMFDSGFGGLTVARALIDLLPGEDLVYVGDTGRYPYGPRPLDEVREFARQITELPRRRARREDGDRRLQHRGGGRARRAAGTSSPVPVVGVIEPGVRVAGARPPATATSA